MEYNSYTDSFGTSGNTPSAQGQVSTSDTPAANRTPHYEVGRGGAELRFDGKGGATLHRDADEVNTFDSATGFGREGDLLSTAVNSSGSPVTGRALVDTDRVLYRGYEVDLRTAQRNRWVTQDALGNWTATDEGNAGASPKEAVKVETKLADGGTAEAAEAAGFRADDTTEQVLEGLVSSVAPTTSMAMVADYARTGEVNPKLLATAAEQAGVSSEEMGQLVGAAMTGLEGAVEKRLEGLGVFDANLFGDFVQSSPELSGRANDALIALMTQNSTEGFDRLASDFVAALDDIAPDEVASALEEAGLPFRRTGGRTLITFGDGTQVTYEVAVKQGLIKVSRNK